MAIDSKNKPPKPGNFKNNVSLVNSPIINVKMHLNISLCIVGARKGQNKPPRFYIDVVPCASTHNIILCVPCSQMS